MVGSGGTSTKLKTKAESILGVIQTVGTIISVIVGSVEERSEYKKSMVPYLIGAVLLFSGTAIPQIIYTLTHNL